MEVTGYRVDMHVECVGGDDVGGVGTARGEFC